METLTGPCKWHVVWACLLMSCSSIIGATPNLGQPQAMLSASVANLATIEGRYCDGQHVISSDAAANNFIDLPLATQAYDCRFLSVADYSFVAVASGADVIKDPAGTSRTSVGVTAGVKSGAYFRLITDGSGTWFVTHAYNDNIAY